MKYEILPPAYRFSPHPAFATVYALLDENNNPFYVGCTTRKLEDRIKGHIIEAKCNNGGKSKNEKIRSLNCFFGVRILETLDVVINSFSLPAELKQTEEDWIRKYRRMGYRLCNVKPFEKCEAA